MSESAHTPGPWKWHWRSEGGLANGSVFSEPREGHAYAVAICPQYQTRGRWESDAALIVRAVNTYPAVAELVKALEHCQSALAMMIEPGSIKQSSVMHEFAQATEAECKARAALRRFHELEGKS